MKNLIAFLLLAFSSLTHAEVPTEQYGVLTLDELPAHTLLVNTFDGPANLFDADTGRMLGMLSTGLWVNAFEQLDGQLLAAETYLSRHHRGTRTDVVTAYDIRTLSAQSEIEIPAKHAAGAPMRHYSGLLLEGNSKFMLVTNVTPAVSVSVVDLVKGTFIDEIASAGCGLVYPADGLSFMQLCGDGTIQHITLDKTGEEIARTRTEPFFDLQDDPLMEKPVLTTKGYVFTTFRGQVFQVSFDNSIKIEKLFDLAAEEEGWRIGGLQPLTYHAATDTLLALMHQGGKDTHKDLGTEVWYYHVDSGRRTHQLTLVNGFINSIVVSQDDDARLYAASPVTNQTDVYDLKKARLMHTIETPSPSILQTISRD